MDGGISWMFFLTIIINSWKEWFITGEIFIKKTFLDEKAKEKYLLGKMGLSMRLSFSLFPFDCLEKFVKTIMIIRMIKYKGEKIF